MTKIFITRKIPEICINELTEKGYEVKVSTKDGALTKTELIEHLKQENFDGLVTLLNDTIDKEVIDNCGNVKIIANFAVGSNNIDTEYAKEKNISVAVARGTSVNAVAQHVIALILAVSDRVIEGHDLVKQQTWKGWDPDLLMGADIFGKTVGLIGFGNIGQKVAEILATGFGCKILYTDMNQNLEFEKKYNAKKVEQKELLENSDIVSLHVPLLPETTHLINSSNLALMKPTAILINTARGPVVDEQALTTALKNKQIFGAGLDVFEFEPKVAAELTSLPNVVMSPHISSAKMSARTEMAIATAKNLIEFLK